MRYIGVLPLFKDQYWQILADEPNSITTFMSHKHSFVIQYVCGTFYIWTDTGASFREASQSSSPSPKPQQPLETHFSAKCVSGGCQQYHRAQEKEDGHPFPSAMGSTSGNCPYMWYPLNRCHPFPAELYGIRLTEFFLQDPVGWNSIVYYAIPFSSFFAMN